MELYAHEEGVVFDFHRFDDASVGGLAAYHQTAVFKIGKVVRIELVSVAVAFFDNVLICIRFFDFRAVFECAGVCAESHRSADFFAFLVGKYVDDVTAAFGKLAARRVLDSEYVACVFDDGDLHTEANSEIGDFVFARVLASANHTLDASRAEAARDYDSVRVFEFFCDVFVRESFAVNPFEVYARLVRAACVLDCFDERNVRVAQGNVFTHDCDFRLDGRDFEVGDFFFPLGEVAFVFERKRLAYRLVKSVAIEHCGGVVKAFYGCARYDGVFVDRAEKRNLFDDFFGRFFVRARHDDVGEYAEALQFAHGMLHGFGLKFVRASHIKKQTDVYERAVFSAYVEAELAQGFEVGLAFDVAHRSAYLGDEYVCARFVCGVENVLFYLVGDVRNDLHGFAAVLAVSFLVENVLVHFAAREGGTLCEVLVYKSFVVSEVEVGFRAVAGYEHLAVLGRVKRTGVDVHIGIEFFDIYAVSRRLQKSAERRCDDSFAESRNDSARYENVLAHMCASV